MALVENIEVNRQKVVKIENFGSSPEFAKMRKHFPKWLMVRSVELVESRCYKATDGLLILLRKAYEPNDRAIVNLKLPCPMAPSWAIKYFKKAYPQFAHINGVEGPPMSR